MRPAPFTLAWAWSPPAGKKVKCTSVESRGPDLGFLTSGSAGGMTVAARCVYECHEKKIIST